MELGIPLTAPFIIWGCGVPAAYMLLMGILRLLNLWSKPTRGGTRGSDIMAFEIVAGLCVTYLGLIGLIGWFQLNPSWNLQYKDLEKDKLYGRTQFVEDHLIAPMITFQGWNLLLCLFNKDLGDPFMIAHHFATVMLGYFGLFPYVHYYGLYFFGVAELSNIPLTLVDMFKYFPDLRRKFPMINQASRLIFAASFIFLRILFWTKVSYEFWQSSLTLLYSGEAHSIFVVTFFLLSNIFLTLLQYFWGFKIVGFFFKKKSP